MGRLVACLSDKAFLHFTLMIDCAPKIVLLTSDFDEDLGEVPEPLSDLPYVRCPFVSDLSSEHRNEAVYPISHALMADIYVSFVEEIFGVTKR